MFKKIKKVFDLSNIFKLVEIINDKNSKIYCQKCRTILPVFRLIIKTKSIKNNCFFQFKCPHCKHINLIKKEIIA